MEEERRLFYVAVTRAQKKVYISHARSRYRFGEVAYQSRSRFIDELDEELIKEVNGGIGRKANRKSKKEIIMNILKILIMKISTRKINYLSPGAE